MTRKLLLYFLFIFLASCAASLRVTSLGDRTYPPTAPNRIEFYFSEPKLSFDEIAYIEAEGTILTSDEDTMNRIRKKAAQLGGDAVIIKEKGRETEYGLGTGPSTVKVVRAVVIRFY